MGESGHSVEQPRLISDEDFIAGLRRRAEGFVNDTPIARKHQARGLFAYAMLWEPYRPGCAEAVLGALDDEDRPVAVAALKESERTGGLHPLETKTMFTGSKFRDCAQQGGDIVLTVEPPETDFEELEVRILNILNAIEGGQGRVEIERPSQDPAS